MGTAGGEPGVRHRANGSPGSYTYSVPSDWANLPVNYLSWGDVARLVNWLDNGQPAGGEGMSTTEERSYTLDGATSTAQLMAVTRNADARILRSHRERMVQGGLLQGRRRQCRLLDVPHAEQHAAPAMCCLSTGTNNANFHDLGGTETYTISIPYYRTAVGASPAGPVPYGSRSTRAETSSSGPKRLLPATRSNIASLSAGRMANASGTAGNARTASDPTSATDWYGFRIASAVLPGDANGDGKVDINDLTIVLADFGRSGDDVGPRRLHRRRHGGHQRFDHRVEQLRHDVHRRPAPASAACRSRRASSSWASAPSASPCGAPEKALRLKSAAAKVDNARQLIGAFSRGNVPSSPGRCGTAEPARPTGGAAARKALATTGDRRRRRNCPDRAARRQRARGHNP